MKTIEELLNLLSLHKGKIISTASIPNPIWIEQAKAGGRMHVDQNGLEFIWEPQDKFPITEEEVALFEKWYPLQMELPDDLNTPNVILDRMKLK